MKIYFLLFILFLIPFTTAVSVDFNADNRSAPSTNGCWEDGDGAGIQSTTPALHRSGRRGDVFTFDGAVKTPANGLVNSSQVNLTGTTGVTSQTGWRNNGLGLTTADNMNLYVDDSTDMLWVCYAVQYTSIDAGKGMILGGPGCAYELGYEHNTNGWNNIYNNGFSDAIISLTIAGSHPTASLQHVCWNFNGDELHTDSYYNGALATTASLGSGASNQTTYSGLSPWTVGGRATSCGTGKYMSGYLDELTVGYGNLTENVSRSLGLYKRRATMNSCDFNTTDYESGSNDDSFTVDFNCDSSCQINATVEGELFENIISGTEYTLATAPTDGSATANLRFRLSDENSTARDVNISFRIAPDVDGNTGGTIILDGRVTIGNSAGSIILGALEVTGAESNFSIYNGATYVPFLEDSDQLEFRCTASQTDCEPTNQDTGSSISIFKICNNGTADGTQVLMGVDVVIPNVALKVDDDYTSAGATTLTTSNQDIHGALAVDACIEVSAWADYTNPTSGGYFIINTTVS